MTARHVGGGLVLLVVLGLASCGWSDTAPASAYAPGRVIKKSDGWIVYAPTGSRFVSQRQLQGVPAEVAAVVALFPGGKPVRQSWGWTLTGAGQAVEVFAERDGFAVSTARETINFIRRSDGFTLSPGRPGVRRVTVFEAADRARRAAVQ